MNGIELSREYYERFGKSMIFEQFSHIAQYVAVGICGKGSECCGYDDSVSRDHDFEPGFIIFLPGEDIVDRRQAFLLERAYAKLPKEYGGIKRLGVAPVGGARHGVIRTSEFFEKTVGSPDGILSLAEWLKIPDYLLFEATNGVIFTDMYGEVTKIRQRLSDMPQDARLKRIAARLILMAQSGQYNYTRCIKHGETAAAQLCVIEFARRAMETAFLLCRRAMPYYKWSFRAMRDLPLWSETAGELEYLITSDNSAENVKKKTEIIEKICGLVSDEIFEQGIAEKDNELERLAYAVNDKIKDSSVRSLSIFCTV